MGSSRFGDRLSPLDISGHGHRPGSSSLNDSQQQLHPYYQTLSPSLQERFGDLDTDIYYTAAEDAVLSPHTHNFVVDFGNAGSYVAVNIGLTEEDDIDGFLGPVDGGGRPKELRTRWICIFAPHRQPALVETIGKRYGLSPRHISLLLSQPPDSINAQPPAHHSRLRRAGERVAEKLAYARKSMEMITLEDISRISDGASAWDISLAPITTEIRPPRNLDTSYMTLVAKVWHWHAVEWGGRFLCIGYNSLHNFPTPHDQGVNGYSGDNDSYHSKGSSRSWFGSGSPTENTEEKLPFADYETNPTTSDNYPEGRRLWTWLILCDDGTVISLHEPHSHRTSPSSLDYVAQIVDVRRNLLTIFRSLSRAPAALRRVNLEKSKGLGSLDELPFRRGEAGGLQASEPSLLFYYLFDDWYSSWSLAIERQHPYTRKLRKLRADLMRNPELKHVDALLHLARQLATLKRMYETYELIIDRILYRQENSLSMAKSGGKIVVLGGDALKPLSTKKDSDSPDSSIMGDPKILGVPLSSHAVARFERLRDRIKLYALAELQDCLDEKDGLVSMTFQLIAFKQTSVVEKLTRVAILFAGATIVFLPLTLLTGFFSMEIVGMKDRWREAHFWGSSGVAILITLILLFGVIKYSVALDSVKLGTQRARAAGQRRGLWGVKKQPA
ncbi:hypothetical protein BDZ91DRAFT_516405 [Kalaharituber pfeilii]|nr:hypothetical protein BDZ91DRAFT_516405 [Kalaharituber pfeilii]